MEIEFAHYRIIERQIQILYRIAAGQISAEPHPTRIEPLEAGYFGRVTF